MENKKQMLLKTGKATYKSVDGVTYFKLRSEFEGDYTKNCGLLGEEIDKNFYFLRGYDIKDIYVDEEGVVNIERVDEEYNPIKIDLSETADLFDISFDKSIGSIVIKYPNGKVKQLEGFLVEGTDIRFATNGSLDGDGTIYNPLRISDVHTTGTYAPVESYFDLTKNPTMPKGKGAGYRIVTKEQVDTFGVLYPLSAVEKISKKLYDMGSQWRVPSKQDWDDLLNAMEVNPEYRNHGSLTNDWFGNVAGSALKSAKYWENYNTLPNDVPVVGQDIVGLSILPLGISPDRNEVLNDYNADIEGFRKIGGMWTSTLDSTGNAYVKLFGYNSAKVDQDTYGRGSRMSLRLVKDFNFDNYSEMETILGLPYPTKLVNAVCDDVKYAKIWTCINVYNTDPSLSGVSSTEWEEISDKDRGVKTVYFINEWDGMEWHKKMMNNGDSVVIINHNDKPYHEWRLVDEVLIDTVDHLMNEWAEIFDEIRTSIREEADAREESDKLLLNAIQNESKLRETVDKQLHEAIVNEGSIRENVDKQLQEAIKQEGNIRKNADDQLLKAINEEGNIRKEQDEQLHQAIIDEGNIRKEQDNTIINLINEEIDLRTNSDTQLRNAINEEGNIRKNVDDQLLKAIQNEGKIRRENDITPGEYILNGDEQMVMTIPTFGDEVGDLSIKVSSDFFNFGKIME